MILIKSKSTILVAWAVETIDDIEIVRKIRNASLDGMTKNAYPTTRLQQLKYWLDGLANLRAWIYKAEPAHCRDGLNWGDPSTVITEQCTLPIGYASLRRAADGKLWSFMAVAPEFRGQGYGRQIQHHHVRQTDEDVYDEILEGNAASLRMTASSGDWRVIERRDGLVYQVSEAAVRWGR